jgi:hypothetical protein
MGRKVTPRGSVAEKVGGGRIDLSIVNLCTNSFLERAKVKTGDSCSMEQQPC